MTAPSRFTGDDLVCLSARIAEDLAAVTGRRPSIAADFNRLMRTAPAAIGCQPIDLRESELEELAEMVLDRIAIARHAYVPAVPADAIVCWPVSWDFTNPVCVQCQRPIEWGALIVPTPRHVECPA